MSNDIVLPVTKICSKCKKEKYISEFSKHIKGRNGIRPDCKKCNAEYSAERWKDPKVRERINAYEKEYRESACGSLIRKAYSKSYSAKPEVKERTRAHWFRTEYGITLEQYKEMYFRQNGNCLICGEHFEERGDNKLTTLHIDHDHESGQVRGLLCHNCNSGIGYLKEDVSLLQKAMNYLRGK